MSTTKSSGGKTTVRKYLEPATLEMRLQVWKRRRQAEEENEKYELQLNAWKSKVKRGKEAIRPEPPILRPRETVILTEATTEALYKALIDTPRGLLWSSSEAHEILGVLGRYSDGSKARDLDTARLRKLTEGEDIEIHRSVDGIRVITRPFVAIDMDAQPGIRDSLFQAVDKVSGFAARFLIHEPTSMFGLRRYVDPPCEPDRALILHLGVMYARLWETRLLFDVNGLVDPQPLYLKEEAERLWALELEHLERRLPTAAPDEEGFFGHLRGRLLRVAGVLALWENPNAGFVDEVAMRRAILIGRYFLRHHRAAARAAREADLTRAVEAIRQWASDRLQAGKDVSVRDAARQWRRYRGPQGTALAVAYFREAGLVPEKAAKTEGPGRPKGNRWVFPNAPSKPAKSPSPDVQDHFAGFVGTVPGPNGNANGDWEARFARLNETLAPELDLPPGGKGTCPLCRHDDCFGRVKDTLFWKCFSDRHAADSGGLADHGDLLDLRFHARAERLPTKEERVQALLGFENGDMP